MTQIRLTLPYPPSANTYWKPARGRGLVPSDEARRYKAAVAQLAKANGVQPLKGPVRLTLRAYRPRRVGDLDNLRKVLLDALQGWAFLDDDQVSEDHGYRLDDAKNPRVEVLLEADAVATPEEAQAHRHAREQRAAKARATRNRNRLLKQRQQARLSSATHRPRSPR
ncbi:RusA family crossover junction endodeoxyribonuclease [Archangium violaceum]|uniref:RusA family crossover junction endodeoxyribonuclease n=1 Tax=Archangium violaceum TaxID=83451 RepID=UPI00193B3315|nr:RusA family crossover junction endodeoxyribonuclease [Archangium violaceum]QRK08087.1 RusA family crossover junction endodeoxyribonuclease [Archangium violaceum]